MNTVGVATQLRDVIADFYDGPHATPPPSDDGPIFLGIQNLTEDGHLDLGETRRIAESDFPKWTKRVAPRPGDLVFTYVATLHRYAIIPDGFRGVLGRRVGLMRPDPRMVDTRFLLYYFLSPQWRSVVTQRINIGSTVDRLPLVDLPNFPVSLPPLPVQRKVVAALSAYDDLIENNTRRIHILEEMAAAIYREWFVEFRFPGHEDVQMLGPSDGVFPETWTPGRIGDLGRVVTGATPPTADRDLWGDAIPFITPTDMDGATPWITPSRKVSASAVDRYRSRVLPKGSVCYTCIASVGSMCMTSEPSLTNQQVNAVVTPENSSSRYFIFNTLKEMTPVIRATASGAATPIISKGRFEAIALHLPPIALREKFGAIVEPAYELAHVLKSANETLRQTRNLLLPRLISGEIDVSTLDIGDAEPAA